MNARTHSQLLQGRRWVPVPGPEELCFGYVEEAQLGLEALEWGKGREAGDPLPTSLISGLFQQFRTWYSGSLYGCGSPSLSCPDLGVSVSLFWVLGSEADHMTVGGPPLQPTWLSVYPSKSLCLSFMSVSVSVSFLVLARWGKGAQCSGSRCRLPQAAGSEAKEGTEPAAPGHIDTLQETHSGRSQKHTMTYMERWALGDIHGDTHIQVHN